MGCIFCEICSDREIIIENDLVYVIFDAFPVTKGHALIIPKRHFSDFFDMNTAELNAAFELLVDMKKRLKNDDPSITGYNIGINSGKSAGQTIPHCHIHLIPRRNDDIENPTGGVRGVIPSQRIYR